MSQMEVTDKNRMERKKEETRLKIISVAMKLFKKNGFNATSMELIAKEVDIAKGTLYNYFPVKEAILDAYVKMTVKEKNPERLLKLQKLPDTRSRLISLLTELVEGIQSQKEIFEKFFVYRVQSVLTLRKVESEKSGIERLASEIITLGLKDGELRSDLPFEALLDLFDFILVEVAKCMYYDPEKFKARKVIELYADLFMNGAKK